MARLIDADAYAAEMKKRQDACKAMMDDCGDVMDTNGVLYSAHEHWAGVFGAFCEAKLVLDDMPTIGGWISTAERQPDRKGIYLARLSDGVYRILGYCNCTDGDMIWFEEGQENDLIEVTDVTHWMPLPEPPEVP